MPQISEKDRAILKRSALFQGLTDPEFEEAIATLSVGKRTYAKGEAVLAAGEQTNLLGMVLGGSVTIENNDVWGNRTVLSKVGPGQFFAEVFALLENEPAGVDVRANEKTHIAYLDMARLRAARRSAPAWLFKLTDNLMGIALQKNLILTRRSMHTAPKSARARVMAYLSSVAVRQHSNEFSIPFDRQQMADYLNLDRSALSKELGRMRDEGLLEFRKNRFRILDANTLG